MRKTSTNLEYFASIEDHKKLAERMSDKIRAYREWADGRGLISLWKKKLINYYGRAYSGNSSQGVAAGGSEGELSLLKVNDLHNLVQNQLVLVTSQRPAGIARAINSDSQSLKASRIGTAIAEHYMSQVGFEMKFVNAAEIALLLDEAFVDLFWDKNAGDAIAVDPLTGMPEMSGDCVLRVHCPWNVARDPGMNVDQQKWHILSYRVNKFDAMAAYPRFADQIVLCKDDDDMPSIPMNKLPEDSDSIFCHLLVHDRTAAVKNGRYALMIGENIVLDTELPFPEYPIERIAPSDVVDGPTGYASSNDILALEEVTDAIHSIITTNEVNFGGQMIVGPLGANINHVDLAKGTRYIEVEPDFVDKIKPLALLHTPPECFNYLQVLGNKKEQALGINSVVRGQPEGQLAGASGAALALVQSQAISFNSGIQRSYFKLLSGAMTKLIGILRVYADTPRIARIVGKSKSSGLKEFKYTGNDLDSISSIVYEAINPIAQTFGGRLEMAKDLLSANQIKSPKQYINLAMTGQLDVLTEDDEADGLLILEENEWLADGKPFKAVITQIHADHIRSHTSQITLEAQISDPMFVARVLEHIQDHINLWQEASVSNPGILMATGQQPLMPPPPPGAPPMNGPQGPPHPAPGPSAPPAQHVPPKPIGQMNEPTSPIVRKANEVKEPNLPNIAGTKQKPTIPGVTTPV